MSAAGQNVSLIPTPSMGSSFQISSTLSGTIGAALNLGDGDASQIISGMLAAVLLGTGTATKQTTVLGSPMGSASNGAYIALEAQNDAGTDVPVITFGTTTTPDSGVTVVFTPIMTVGPYFVLVYSGSSGTVTVTHKSGSGNIPIPAGVTVGYGEAWGPGASLSGTSGGVNTAEGGCGGGAYAAEPTLEPVDKGSRAGLKRV